MRKGNPKNVRDWGDLVKGDIQVITPNPKTGGAPRWAYLAGWGWALNQELGDLNKVKNSSDSKVIAAQKKEREYITALYQHVPVLDSSARFCHYICRA